MVKNVPGAKSLSHSGKLDCITPKMLRRGQRELEEKRITLAVLKEELEALRQDSKAVGSEREAKEMMKNLHKEYKVAKSQVAEQESLIREEAASLSKLKATLDLEKTKLEKLDPSSSSTVLGVEAQAQFDISQSKLTSLIKDLKISSDKVLGLMEQIKEKEREELKIKKQKEDDILVIEQNKFEYKQIKEITLPQARSKASSKESWTVDYELARNASKVTKVDLEKVRDSFESLEYQVQMKNSKIQKAVLDYRETRLFELFEMSKLLESRKDEISTIITSQEYVRACIKLTMEQISTRNESLQEIRQIVTSGEVRIKQINRRIANFESQIGDELSTLSNLKPQINALSPQNSFSQIKPITSTISSNLSRFEIFKIEKELKSLADDQSRLKEKIRREVILQESLSYDQAQLSISIRRESARKSELEHYLNLSRKDSEKVGELEGKVRELSMVLARKSDRTEVTASQLPKPNSSSNSTTGTPSFVVQDLIKTVKVMSEALQVLRSENTELLLQMAEMY